MKTTNTPRNPSPPDANRTEGLQPYAAPEIEDYGSVRLATAGDIDLGGDYPETVS